MKPVKFSLAVILIFIFSMMTGKLYQCHQEYYAQYYTIKAEFEKMKDVTLVELDGSDDDTFEDIYGTIRLKNGNTLRFFHLKLTNFTGGPSIELHQINNWYFHKTGYTYSGTQLVGDFLELGESSPYEKIRSLHLGTIRDVIDHFDELHGLIQKISVYPRFDTLHTNQTIEFFQRYNDKVDPGQITNKVYMP